MLLKRSWVDFSVCKMTALTNPSVSASSSLKGQKDFIRFSGSEQRPNSLKYCLALKLMQLEY